jgi:tRNA(fMet)-specific endonuclease VapC
VTYYLDTNICIFYLTGKSDHLRERLLARAPSEIRIPAIVAAELCFGVKRSAHAADNAKRLEKFLSPFLIVPFDHAAAVLYGEIRAALLKKNKLIAPNDLIVAATALANNATLVTNNTKEFSRVARLQVADWTTSGDSP